MSRSIVAAVACLAVLSAPVWSEDGDSADLAKQSQNPVSNLISVPLQNNTSFGIGPEDALSNVLNIQPVIPTGLTEKWNLINRGIIPVIYAEEAFPGTDDAFGLGDTSYTAYFSPAKPGKVIWGVGPSVLLPTATEDQFASDKWSGGFGVVLLTMPGNWVTGVLFGNVWSFAGDNDAEDVSAGLIQPIINYNFDKGWYLSSVPVFTVNWEAPDGEKWTIPLGGGGGRIMKWGKQPVDLSAQAFYNVEAPDDAADWTLRLQLKLLFPK